jgi:hypothetical protein
MQRLKREDGNMSSVSKTIAKIQPPQREYDPPRLILIGDAREVVLGPPGGGWDGPYGISEPHFEFEPDGDDS